MSKLPSSMGRRNQLLLGGLGAAAIVFALIQFGFRQSSTAQPRLQVLAAESLVFTSDDGYTTRLWLADPAKPSVRRLLHSISHSQHWVGIATVSPDGSSVAYTRLPQGHADPDHDAELRVLNLQQRQDHLLANGVDLRSPLVWAPESDSLIFERYAGRQEQVWQSQTRTASERLLSVAGPGEVIVPVGFSSEPRHLLLTHFSRSRLDLERAGEADAGDTLIHLSSGSARNLILSRDGMRLAFLETSGDSPSSHAVIVDLRTGTADSLPPDWGEAVGLAWTPDGRLTVGVAGPSARLRYETGDSVVDSSSDGFEQPLAWSPSGRYLAVRSFTGKSGDEAGIATDTILDPLAGSASLTDALSARFSGWSTVHDHR